jgi:DNA helicase-2/ATP-dependent DNA helicase PcrA
VVGDDDQAIMRFQGASVTYINQFEQHYPQLSRCVLKTNYRSTPSLVELGRHVATQIENRSVASRTEKVLSAARSEDKPAQFAVRAYPSKETQYFATARAIREAIDAGFLQKSANPDEAIAVIAPKHDGLRGMIPYLKLFEIPFNYRYTTSVTGIASLQSLLALLRLLADYSRARPAFAEANLPQFLAAPELGLAPEDYIGLALEAKRQNISWLDALKASAKPELRRLHALLLELIAEAAAAPVRRVIARAAEPFVEHWKARSEEDPFALIELNYGLKALLDFVEGELGSADVAGAAALPGGATAVGGDPAALSGDPDVPGGDPAALPGGAGSFRPAAFAPLRLADVMDRFAEAERYGITIDASLPLARASAITLTTAHSSKGLEFDRVYLLDADDASWHPSNKGGALLPQNLLFGNQRDLDDARRLLFVALTRARFELLPSHGGRALTRELLDAVAIEQVSLPAEELVVLSENSWQDSYRLSGEEYQELLRHDLAEMKMSASRLNAFVEYRDDGANSSEFVSASLLRLPSEPAVATEFGTLVHSLMEEYLNHVLKSGELSLERLAERCHQRIQRLDFEPTELEQMHQRLNSVIAQFLPQLGDYLSGEALTERWVNAELEGIPLVGKCDLLVLDEAQKTIKVFDFKTTLKLPERPSSAYIRQLQFYRLLLESSPEFSGYRVASSADLLVEPLRELNYQLHQPEFFSVSDAELEQLRQLVQAVWFRIQNGLFDTSGFSDSSHYQQMLAANLRADGTPRKRLDRRALQAAYEQWLIDDWRAAAGTAATASGPST